MAPNPQTVLVVDDNEANRQLAQGALEDEGYRVVTATSGASGVEVFGRENPDCVVLDVRMQNGDGFEACEGIRRLPGGEDVPVIFLTALRDVDTFDRARKAGGDDFLTKPVRPDDLVMRVQTALAMKDRRTELYDMLKKQRDDLLRVQLQKERLAAFVVHDLKNPVNAMDLHAQLLLRDASLSESSRKSVTQIRSEAKQLNRMILNLLDVSKGDEGKLVAKIGDVDLVVLVDAVISELTPAAASRKLQLTKDVGIATIRADADLLERTLSNLIDNALRHSPAGSTVRVSATATKTEVELRVVDAGPGVPVEMRKTIFEPFVQLADGQPARANRGLGLAFCKVATVAQNGTLTVEDASPGAVFVLRIPQ